MLQSFKKLYHNTWKDSVHKDILRKGSHIMLGDNHDFYEKIDTYKNNTPGVLEAKEALFSYQYSLMNGDKNDTYFYKQ